MLLESERSKGLRCPHPPLDTTLSGSSAPVCPDPDPSETSSGDKGGVHSESENKRGASGKLSCIVGCIEANLKQFWSWAEY